MDEKLINNIDKNKLVRQKYVVLDSSYNIKWELIYCNNHSERNNETDEEIAKALTSHIYDKKFNSNEYICANGPNIRNDEKLFVLTDMTGLQNIWQVGSKVYDITGCIIPHVYQIRKIGIIIP